MHVTIDTSTLGNDPSKVKVRSDKDMQGFRLKLSGYVFYYNIRLKKLRLCGRWCTGSVLAYKWLLFYCNMKVIQWTVVPYTRQLTYVKSTTEQNMIHLFITENM